MSDKKNMYLKLKYHQNCNCRKKTWSAQSLMEAGYKNRSEKCPLLCCCSSWVRHFVTGFHSLAFLVQVLLSLCMSIEFSFSSCTDLPPVGALFAFWVLFPRIFWEWFCGSFLPCFTSKPKIIPKHTDSLRFLTPFPRPLESSSLHTLKFFHSAPSTVPQSNCHPPSKPSPPPLANWLACSSCE